MLTIGLGCAVLLGLVLGGLVPLSPPGLAASAALAATLAVLARHHPPWRYLGLLGCAMALGALRATLAAAPMADASDPLAGYTGLSVALRGVVLEPPTLGPRSSRVVLAVEAVAPAGQVPRQASHARVGVVDWADGPLAAVGPGDVLEVTGTLGAPVGRAPPTILFPQHVAVQRTAEPDLPRRLRMAAGQTLRELLPAPQGALAAGVLLGGSAGLDPTLRLQLQRAGLAHLLAVDGYKQVVLAAALRSLGLPLLGARGASLVVLPGVAAYTLLAAARPSALRAGLMVGLAELAGLTGRAADPLTSLVLTATLMAVVEPGVLLDAGWQLSVSATLGLVLLWPRVQRRLRGLPRPVAEPAGLTLVVTLATLPVVLSLLPLVPLVSPLAHVVALPLVAPVLLGAALLALVGSVAPGSGLAAIVAWLAWLPCTALVACVRLFGSLPGAALATGRLGLPAAAALAAGLLAWGIWGLPEAMPLRVYVARHDPTRHWPALRAAVATLLAGLVALGCVLLVRPDGRLHVRYLAAEPGQAVLIRGPTGQTALVVAGRVNGSGLAEALADALPVWEHGVDGLLVLDAQAAARVQPVLDRYTARQRIDLGPETALASRLDLGGGAALDAQVPISASVGAVEVTVRFGSVELGVLGAGAPPAPAVDELISDGTRLLGQP